MENQITQYQGPAAPMTVADVKGQVNLIQHIMKEVMKDGDHFGAIPGCGPKPTLLKSGAEKLAMTFRFAVDPQVEILDLPNYHREYRIRVGITNSAGEFLGAGVGCCSTLEGKFRFRTGPTVVSDNVVPKAYWDMKKTDPAQAQKIIGGPGFTTKKGENGIWYIATQGEKCEHDNPADYWNTVLKMAKKRALVDAILTVTAASDIFTQDIEDDPSLYAKTVYTETPKDTPKTDPPKSEPKKETKKESAPPTPPAEDKSKAPATPEQIQKFWEVIQILADETGDDRDEIIKQMSKGKVDPLDITEVPGNWVVKLTDQARDMINKILGGE